MVELEQYKYQWNQYADQLEELRKAFDIQAKKERIEEIEGIMEEQGFWDNLTTVSYTHLTLPTILLV